MNGQGNSLMDTERSSHNWVAILLHWIVAGLFVYLFFVALTMTSMDSSDEKWLMYDEHKQFGILVGIVIMFRLIWKFTSVAPSYPEGHAKWQERLAASTHLFLYLVMIMFPVSGYMMSMAGGHGIEFFGFQIIDVMGESELLSDIAHDIHWWLEKVTYVLVGAHIAAALYHHFIIKNNVLKGMITSDRIR